MNKKRANQETIIKNKCDDAELITPSARGDKVPLKRKSNQHFPKNDK